MVKLGDKLNLNRQSLANRRLIQPSRRQGFTLIEIIFVILLIGVMFSFIVPKINNITPKYRQRSYARTIANMIQRMRVFAIAKGKNTGIRYDLDADIPYLELIPPADPEYPDEPFSERKAILREEAPPGVQIRGIVFPGSGGGMATEGIVHIGFSPNGTTGSHIVILESQSNPDAPPEVLSVKFNSISGVMDYYNHEVEFQHYEE